MVLELWHILDTWHTVYGVRCVSLPVQPFVTYWGLMLNHISLISLWRLFLAADAHSNHRSNPYNN